MCVTVNALKVMWKTGLNSCRRHPYTDRAQKAVEEVGPGNDDSADYCLVDDKTMTQLSLGTASGQVCEEEEELIYR